MGLSLRVNLWYTKHTRLVTSVRAIPHRQRFCFQGRRWLSASRVSPSDDASWWSCEWDPRSGYSCHWWSAVRSACLEARAGLWSGWRNTSQIPWYFLNQTCGISWDVTSNPVLICWLVTTGPVTTAVGQGYNSKMTPFRIEPPLISRPVLQIQTRCPKLILCLLLNFARLESLFDL